MQKAFSPEFTHFLIAIAAEDKESDDNDPDAVVIEESAKAVCHGMVLRKK